MVDVSVIIVCMNNLHNLYLCLDSIKTNTNDVNYEVFVVAYLFTHDNLQKAKTDYPWVNFVESNEIRGFSENNNLALKKAKGRYCFILNDDTYHNCAVIDTLFRSIESLPKSVATISPVTLNRDGSIQRCGRAKFNFFIFLISLIGFRRIYEKESKYTNKTGVFQTYNISGACFLIKREVFAEVGWFDERYFFCPEDVALSTLLNKKGYKCYVDTSVELYHLCGESWSKVIMATKPASAKGIEIFFSDESFFQGILYKIISIFVFLFKAFYWTIVALIKGDQVVVKKKANLNAAIALLSKKTPKDIFIHYYEKAKTNKH